ncbi:MAG: T9SS type A sorting domain-containing protein [Bacteroidetes bacterium]|nr:T9SS type A sorting domain-containing protein [Bacteroidota bacterium]
MARRGNPAPTSNPGSQIYCIDSDDDDSRAPGYFFVDTTYDANNWHRVNTLVSGTDDGYVETIATDSITFNHFNRFLRLPPRYITTNGLMKLTIDTFMMGADLSAANAAMPINFNNGGHEAIVCPMWGDLEFRTTGDSSKVFYRMTTDSCYVTYYNLFLKGTNGQARVTCQVAFSRTDSSMQFNYRSFDGSFAGVPAAMLFQQTCTIGSQNYQSVYGTTYLDRGTYYAKSYSSAIYAKDLHNQLAVKFIRFANNNYVRMNSINFPPYNGYEMSNNQFQPVMTFENLTNFNYKLYIRTQVINLTTGNGVYSRTDSVDVGNNSSYQYTGSLFGGLTCGHYRMTTTVSVPRLGTDNWVPDNIMTRDFVFLNGLSAPLYDDYNTLDPCSWHIFGGSAASGLMYDQPGPVSTNSLLLNRRDDAWPSSSGNLYQVRTAADTVVTAPINLSGKSNVWLAFAYQRGKATDSLQAGVNLRTLPGPEPILKDTTGAIIAGDSLIIEGTKSTAPKWNAINDSNWTRVGAIAGGLDLKTQMYRIQVPSALIHDHSRFRLRLKSQNDVGLFNSPPFDDDDSWLVDGFQVNLATNGQTELSPYQLDLGNGLFTHIPRSVKNITPRITISSNALQTNLASYNVRLIIWDALNRQVYHKLQTLYSPLSHNDTVMSMPAWDVSGSQGGTFTAKIQIELNFQEIRRPNDTITMYRNFAIDDRYAYDDGVPDTAGTMVVADPHFYMDFTPLASDSLRAADFFMLDANGTTNWALTVRGSGNQVVGARTFSYNTLERGFMRGTFSPIYLSRDSVYRIEFNMTSGTGLGGDAARGLVWKIRTGSTPYYSGLYPKLLAKFRDVNSNQYLVDSNSTARNASGGGPILPMVRLVFTGSSTYLPIELASFTARRTSTGQVLLDFATAKEQDVRQFELERETQNGWQNVATLAATNAALGSTYSALDATAPFSSQTYRLSEVDLDGSQKVAGYATASPFGSSSPMELTVSPNPASNRLHVSLTGVTDRVELRVYDMLGKVVLASDGQGSSTDLDVSTLAAGTYTLQTLSGGEEHRATFVVQK